MKIQASTFTKVDFWTDFSGSKLKPTFSPYSCLTSIREPKFWGLCHNSCSIACSALVINEHQNLRLSQRLYVQPLENRLLNRAPGFVPQNANQLNCDNAIAARWREPVWGLKSGTILNGGPNSRPEFKPSRA
jgi:hypothetical protein